MICPNKNLPEWKALEKTNPELALYYWNIHNGNPPNYLTDSKVLEDLFESNPELANAVYEALGYSYTGEYSPAALYESGIKTPDKKDYLTYSVVKNNLGQRYINTLNKGRRSTDKGIGKNAYYKFIIENQGKAIATDTELSVAGRKVLEQLEKENYVVKTDAVIIQTKESGAGYTLDVYDKPLYQFTGKIPKSYLTFEQEQQAQQLYSQYLDSIFPDSKVKDIVYHGTKGDKFDKFKSSETGTFGKGVYFGDYKTALQNTDLLDDFTLEPRKGFDKDKIIPALINTQNIFQRDLGGNGIRNEYVVEPEQIHILGSKQDIEGFKQYLTKDLSNPLNVDFEDCQ